MNSYFRIMTVVATCIFMFASNVAKADDMVWLTGRILDESGKRPASGAMVAVYDDKNRVVDYAKADEEGNYALAVPRSALHLDKKGGGFFHTVTGLVGGAGRIASLPIKAGIKAAAAASTVADPLTKIGIGAASGVAQTLADGMSPRKNANGMLARNAPGAVVVKVTLPGKNDAVCIGRVYWVEEQVYRTRGKEQNSLTAWLDPVSLTSIGSEKKSVAESIYLTFTESNLSPSIAEIGQTVRISVRFPSPPEPRTQFIIVARNNSNGQMWELTHTDGDMYKTEFTVDKKFKTDDQSITVLAYAAQDDTPGRIPDTENALAKSGYFDNGKLFVYNPLWVVNRNRAELTLTVVKPNRRK